MMRTAFLLLLVAVTLAGSDASEFASAGKAYRFAFPEDHGSHSAYRTEWWYFTGHLAVRAGRRFGYELTFFRVGLRPGDPAPSAAQSKWRGHQVYLAHLAITDDSGRRFVYAERFAREALGAGYAATGRLEVRVGDWSLRGKPELLRSRERMTLRARSGTGALSFAVDLTQRSQKPPAVHGESGISRKGSCGACASHYYSYTRLRTTGTLTYRGVPLKVDGVSWMDHEFTSSQLEPGEVGWDWFSVQLDDGREVMFYRLRDRNGTENPQSSGSLIERDGRVRFLRRSDVLVQALSSWKSVHTGATYPSGWHFAVPSAAVDVTLTPTVADQELANANSPSYWEGAVDVMHSGARIGAGYVELTGYAAPVAL